MVDLQMLKIGTIYEFLLHVEYFVHTLLIPTQGHVLMFMVRIRKLSSERLTDLLKVIQLEALSMLGFCHRESLSTLPDGEHVGSGG